MGGYVTLDRLFICGWFLRNYPQTLLKFLIRNARLAQIFYVKYTNIESNFMNYVFANKSWRPIQRKRVFY